MDAHLVDDMAVRSSASLDAASFGIRRASDVARLPAGGVKVDTEAGAAEVKVNRRKNDQCGLGLPTHLLAAKSLVEARPAP